MSTPKPAAMPPDQIDREGWETLLIALAVGARTAIDTPEDWAARFGTAPLNATFAAQLAYEWQPAEPPTPECAVVREKVKARIAQWHTGWPNLWSHILRVTGFALFLAPELKLDAAPVYCMAMIHDIGKFDEMSIGIDHEEIGERAAREFLADVFDKGTIYQIASAIRKEDRSGNAFADVLYDADKLDKIGASGIVRRVSQVLTIENARDALARVGEDLNEFPMMHTRRGARLAAEKSEFTSRLIAVGERFR